MTAREHRVDLAAFSLVATHDDDRKRVKAALEDAKQKEVAQAELLANAKKASRKVRKGLSFKSVLATGIDKEKAADSQEFEEAAEASKAVNLQEIQQQQKRQSRSKRRNYKSAVKVGSSGPVSAAPLACGGVSARLGLVAPTLFDVIKTQKKGKAKHHQKWRQARC